MEINMDKKLIIEPKKFKTDQTTVVSSRISLQLMRKIEDLAKKTNRNRNELIQILLDFAIENVVVQIPSEKEGEK